MSSVSAACIFGAYSASSAHTDTFYIVSQIVRVRNSKRHFFSKLTFRISFSRSASPYGNIDHNCSASPYGHIDHNRSAFTLRPHRPQPLRFTLRPHRPQPPRFHPTATSTTTAPLHPTATSTTACHFAQQSRLNSSDENFSYFFKKALDKHPKTVYNVYCYLGVAQIGSALPWGGRGRRFKSCHSDHNVETKKMSLAKSPIISGFFATQTAIFLCTKTQM